MASSVSTNLTTAMIPGKVILNAAKGAAYETRITPATRPLTERVKAWFTEFARKVWETVKEKFSDPTLTFAAVKNLVNVCMSSFLQAAAPLVSGGIDIIKGLVNTMDAAFWRGRNAGDALHKRPFEFTHWYRKSALNSPALAILTLNSGICGDKMVYLSMFTDEGRQISTTDFQQGARFLDNLKPWGAEYLGNSGYSFRSSSEMVGKLLTFAGGHADQRNKVWSTVRKIANA